MISGFSIRDYKQYLETCSRLITVQDSVNLETEVPDILKAVNGETGLFFEQLNGYNMPVISGLCGNREDLAHYQNMDSKELRNRIARAIKYPTPWQIVDSGVCQEEQVFPLSNLFDILPVPKFNEGDSGRFITAGNIMVWDKRSRKISSSVRRLQVNEDNTLSILIESPGLWKKFLDVEAGGENMDIAVVLGVHPYLTLASQLNSQLFDQDKVAVAGALIGGPVPMVKCQTIDCYVPADAELVIEGKMMAKVRYPEGPFGELAGYYGPSTDQPIIKISQVTHRHDPWFQVISPGSNEHKLPGALMRELVILKALRHVVPEVHDVHVTMAGGGRFHAVVSLTDPQSGQGKTAIIAALGSNKDLKHVVVVNDDVDIFNAQDVEWAIATRVQADLDVLIIPGCQGSPLEPSHTIRGISAKMGIDATYPPELKRVFTRIKKPQDYELIRNKLMGTESNEVKS